MRKVFIGGTGHSGTTPVARILGRHSKLAQLPAEIRLHIAPKGLMNLQKDSPPQTLSDFLHYAQRHYEKRLTQGKLGIHQWLESEQFERILAQFEKRFLADKQQGSRWLLDQVLNSYATKTDKVGWIEHSPENSLFATDLYQLYPDLKFVYCVRDGRDVAASVIKFPWAPDTIPEAIRWWGERTRLAYRQLAQLPQTQVHYLRLESFVVWNRQTCYQHLLNFLELKNEPAIDQFFNINIVVEKAHIGNWQTYVPAAEHDGINKLYHDICQGLQEEQIDLPGSKLSHDWHEATKHITYQRLFHRLQDENGRLQTTLKSKTGELKATQERLQHQKEKNHKLFKKLDKAKEKNALLSKATNSPASKPLFVIGSPRSGTSMMQWALRQHSSFWGGQESDFLIPLMQNLHQVYQFGTSRGRLHWLSGQDVSWSEFLQSVGIGIDALYMSRSGGLDWVEQTPQYTLHLEGIAHMFPQARFLFMARDGRDVVHSLRHFSEPVPHEEACRRWVHFTEAGLDFGQAQHGHRLHTVYYDQVTQNTAQEMTRICQFLDVPFEIEPVNFIQTKRINSSFHADQLAVSTSTPKWSSWTREERLFFEETAGHLLFKLGFAQDSSWIDEIYESGKPTTS